MGSRLSYTGNQKDLDIIDLCQQLILSCLPDYKNIHFSDQKEKNYFFEGLTNEQMNLAFSSKKMELHLYLEILQRLNIAYNEPDLLIFIQNLLHDKTFFFLNKKGNIKRYLTKAVIDKALRKHLFKVVPKEFRFLINNTYFLQYLNELFLPLEKNRIMITIEKFFELSIYEKNSLYNKFDIRYEEYEMARNWINQTRIRYKDILEKYKNDPEYQTIEKIQSIQMEIKNNRLQKVDDDKTFDHTVDDFYAE
jgi:hypothetical protein